MRIGVISDTHRKKSNIEQIRDKIKDLDLLIHLGDNVEDVLILKEICDGEIINIKGNCDFSTSVPSERIEEICGKRIFLTHGHRYDVKNSLFKLRYKALEVEADIVLYGHTHVAKIDFEEGIWYINPGSLSEPRDGYRSLAIIEITEQGIEPNLITV